MRKSPPMYSFYCCLYGFRKGILKLEIQAGMTHLDVNDAELGWKEETKTYSKTPEQIHKARVKISMERLDDYFEAYFSLSHKRREVASSEGEFVNPLPTGKQFWKYAKFTLPAEKVSLNDDKEDEGEEEQEAEVQE